MSSALDILKRRRGSGTSLASGKSNTASTSLIGTGKTASQPTSGALSILSRRSGAKSAGLSQAQIYARGNTSSAALKNGPSGTPVPTGEGSKNRGGVLGGLGYFTEKVTLGTVQGIEGIFDFLIGGAADLFGADKFAERQFANDWLNYSHADEWYNPGEGWKTAGDVAGGVGSSLPGIATAAVITYFTGGAGAGLGAALVAGTSAAGTATKEAYQETGKLTGKEWGYGVLSGVTEAAVEKISGGLGAGAGAIGKKIGQAFGKTAAKEVGKTTVKTVAVDLGKNFLSEAFEEGFSELMAPQYKKLTYDPNAKNATAGEIAYAALVGGLSGILTSGAGTAVTQVVNIRKGAKAETSGSVDRIKAISEVILEANEGKGDEQSINAVRELYHDITEGKLKITAGVELNVKQKRALGELQTANMAALFQPKMAKAAANAIGNAESVVERLNSYGNIKMVDGKFASIADIMQFKKDNPKAEVRDITVEDLRAGYDEKNGKQALSKAMQKNEVLRYVAASDVAGRLIMSVEQFEKTSLEGTTIKDQVALNKFIEEASPEKRRALGAELSIAENEWDTLHLGRLNEAVRSYRESGKAEAYQSRLEAVNKAKSVDESAAKKKIPSRVALGDGKVERYKTDKVDIAVYRNGDSFVVFDYNENAPSRALSRAEVNSVLEQMRSADSAADVAKTLKTAENAGLTNTEQENVSVSGGISPSARMSMDEITDNPSVAGGDTLQSLSPADAVQLPLHKGAEKSEAKAKETSAMRVSELKERLDAKRIDSYAAENIEGYSSLGEANKSMIRQVVREGRANGLDDADVLTSARVAARTGLNIEYDTNTEDGVAGYYDPRANKIVVNPKAAKRQELVLIHELDHALRAFRGNDGKVHYLVYKDADKRLSDETWSAIQQEYADQDIEVSREELLADEASAYYTEAILGGKGTVDLLLGKEPSLAKKILNFFTGAARAYSGDEKLAKEARRHYRNFKKMFDAFSEWNKGRNAETAVESTGDGKSARQSKEVEAKLAEYKKPITHNDILTLRSIGRKSVNEFTSADIDAAGKWAHKFYKELGAKSPFFRAWFGDWRAYDNKKIPIVRLNTEKITNQDIPKTGAINIDTGWKIEVSGKGVDKTSQESGKWSNEFHSLKNINEMLTNAVLLDSLVVDNPSKKLGSSAVFMHNLYCPVSLFGAIGIAKLYVSESYSDTKTFYLTKIEMVSTDSREATKNASSQFSSVDTNISVSQIYEFVKQNDKKYEAKSKNPVEFRPKSVNPALLNEDGTPKVFYHGTRSQFTAFELQDKPKFGRALGDGFYFTPDYDKAFKFANGLFSKGQDRGGIIMPVYLRMENPYIIEKDADRTKWAKEYNAGKYDGIIDLKNDTYYVEGQGQIKSATDNIGTFDGENKDIRFSKDITPKVAEESGIEKSIGKLGEGEVESVAGRDAKAGARRAAAYSRRRQDMTVGQLRQMIARYTGEKVYTSKDARETIDNIYGIYSLSQKNRAKLYEALWQGYNACKTDNERAEFSYDMAEYVTVMLLSESSVENPDKPGIMETLSKLKSGIGHLTFNDSQRADLRHVLDKSGYKRFIGRWGFRETMQPNRRRIAVDVFIHNLGEENPEYAYLKEMTPQDAILELDRIYEQTLEASKQTIGVLDDMPDHALGGMIDDIGAAIYESFSTKGEKSTVEKVIEARMASAERKYANLKQKYDELERKYYDEQDRPRKLLNISYQIQKMKDLRLGTFLNATDFKNEVFKQTFEILGTIEFRGDISPKKVRLAMKRLAEWYKADNPVLKDIDGAPGSGYYSKFTALLINNIAEGEGDLSMFELNALDNILRHATHIVENFNRVWKNGKWVKADDTAKGFVGVAESATLLRSSADMRKISRLFDNVGRRYLTAFGDPMTLFRYMDGYQEGFFTWAGEELRTGAFRHGVDVMEMKADYDAFLEGKSHKGYVKKASKEAVEYGGAKMSKLQYISLYMTMQRQQAQRGLAENGFSLIDVNGQRVEVDGFLSRIQARIGSELGIKKSPDGTWKITEEQMKAAVESEIAEIKKQLTEEDLQFVGIIERTLNGKCKELKQARDMERLGYSNTISGYYYPIVRAMIAKTIDSQGMWGELDRASNISANKDTVKGAAGALWIESADTVFNRHIDAVARYAELSPAIDAINKIFNLDISGNKNKPRSVRTATFNSWQTSKLFGGAPSDVQRHNGEAYLKDLLADLQGIGKNAGIGEKFAEGLRGGFAISALAANPKVLMTQLSSVLASTNILSMKSVSTGMKLGFGNGVGEDMDVYCPVAKLRNYDSSAAKAQGVIENVRGVGEKLMTLVSAMDRGVVRMLWGACQVEVESTKGHKIGTEENKVEAGKLLERVIQETQQNSIATEKSAAMRSKSMLMKSLTMFTSDAMKSVGRVIDAFGHLASLNARIKAAEALGDAETANTLKGEREGVVKQARKSVGALVLTSVYMTLIARSFSWLYAKDEEEERPVLAFIADVFGGMLGGLPIISDIYEFFVSGYDLSDNVYDTLNGVLEGVSKVVNTAGKMINGEATAADMNGAAIYFAQTVGTVLGLPIRNVRNMVMGLTRRFNPNVAYKMEMLTKSKNFASDFEEAVEAGDDDKAMMILGLLLEERLGEDAERTVGDAGPYRTEILRMSKAGYNILPRTIGDSVTIGGEEVIMYPEEQAALRARYSEAVGVIESLVGSSAYASLSDEQRESAVRFVYDVYYDQGIYELYGYERNMKRRVFSKVISVDKLALANAVTAGLESDYEDERGNVVTSDKWATLKRTTAKVNYSAVSGSKRKKVIAAINKLPLTTAEKLLIIAYKGYTIKNGDIRGVSAERAKRMLSSYAKKQGLTKDEARALEEYL